jgi:hypothetical protein
MTKYTTFFFFFEKRQNNIFKNIFQKLVTKAQDISCKAEKKFKDPLRVIDASVIPLCLERFNWAKYGAAKGAIKLHLNLDGDNRIPFDAYLTNGKVHEVKQIGNLTCETGVICAMDRGYVDYKPLYSIELQGSVFVTRIKNNGAFRRVRNNPRGKDEAIISDVLIELTGTTTKKLYPKPLRKVKYCDKGTKKTYEFMTNDMEREAVEIALIYKERWEVELFFKWIKQHLKIKSFWGTSQNAVYSQIRAALILTIIIWINRALEGITVSPYELLVMIKSTLSTKNTLSGLCTNISISMPAGDSFQLLFEGFKC